MSATRKLTVLSLLLAACGGGSTGPDGGGGIGTFTAVIDGVAWTSDAATLQVSGAQTIPGTQLISGTKLNGQDYVNVMLTLGYISGPGTYPLGVNQGTTAGGSGAVTGQTGAVLGIWNTGFSGNAGSVTITSLTSSRMTGTFQFTAPPQLGSAVTGNRVVTNGSFDVPLATGFVVPPANNRGSKISATLGGTAWNGATVVGLGQGGAFSLGGTSSTYNLSLVTQLAVTAGNTYGIGGNNGFSVTASQGANAWGGVNSSGSVTITSLANGRVTGTFTGSLGRAVGSALTVTNGTFDVRIDAP